MSEEGEQIRLMLGGSSVIRRVKSVWAGFMGTRLAQLNAMMRTKRVPRLCVARQCSRSCCRSYVSTELHISAVRH
jgi:hypothetical protein